MDYAMRQSDVTPKNAMAKISGGSLNPMIAGVVFFYDVPGGTDVCVKVEGLPNYQKSKEGAAQIGPHGFHIHEFGDCEVGDVNKPFPNTGGHFNPNGQPHGNHLGDFPVLFSNNGYSKMCFFTNKFKPSDIIGKSIVIHESPDDYKTEPSGNSGKKIACGVIVEVP